MTWGEVLNKALGFQSSGVCLCAAVGTCRPFPMLFGLSASQDSLRQAPVGPATAIPMAGAPCVGGGGGPWSAGKFTGVPSCSKPPEDRWNSVELSAGRDWSCP